MAERKKMNKTLKEHTRTNWVSNAEKPSMEEIQLGAILRIADTLDKMAVPYQQLMKEIENYKMHLEEARFEISRLRLLVNSSKKQIKKLKEASVTIESEPHIVTTSNTHP